MGLEELKRKSGYYHGHMILEDCVENGEILYDRALKKSLKTILHVGKATGGKG